MLTESTVHVSLKVSWWGGNVNRELRSKSVTLAAYRDEVGLHSLVAALNATYVLII